MQVLVCNIGSTSLKYKLFSMPDEDVICNGGIANVGASASKIHHTVGNRMIVKDKKVISSQQKAIDKMIALLTEGRDAVVDQFDNLDAIVFKVVGADGKSGTVLLDEDVLERMETFIPVLPRHNPPYIDAIRYFMNLSPSVPLIGRFETSFHATIPEKAHSYGIPRKWSEELGIRRLGFHGASFTHISSRVQDIFGHDAGRSKTIACHLGGSSSICAIKDNCSIDTSMGMSTQAGLPMSSRCGDVDAFAVLYAMDSYGLTTDQTREILCSEGGLAGISGLSSDMEEIERAASEGHRGAIRARDNFVYEVKKYIGSYAVALEGIDTLVFSGGIGENSSTLRLAICEGLEFLGININAVKNSNCNGEMIISVDGSPVKILVIPANEEIVLARSAVTFLGEHNGNKSGLS